MKTQLINSISKKYLLPVLPAYKNKGHLIYHTDLTHFLRGFCFESSAFDKDLFTIEVFVQPLFIPVTYLTFTFGNRLGMLSKGKDIWWKYDEVKEEEIMAEILSMISSHGIPFLEERNTLKKFLFQNRKIGIKDNLNKVEALGYTHILIENYPKAKSFLSSFNQKLETEIEKSHDIAWMVEMKNRVQRIHGFLENEDFARAKEQLDQWRSFTVKNLGILDA